MNWFRKIFGPSDKMETDIYGLPYLRNLVPMPEVKPCKPSPHEWINSIPEYIEGYHCKVEGCTFTNNSTLEGLKIALKHSTKYEDRMYLSFLIRVELSKDNPEAIYGIEDVV